MKRICHFGVCTPLILLGALHAISSAEEAAVRPGRHLFVGVSGATLTDEERVLLREVQPAGVVLLGVNARDEAQTRALVSAIKEAAGIGNGLADPPLIAVDQEGGRINRLRLDDAPSAAAIGATGDSEQARATGRRYAVACRERGIAIVLSPVLDVRRDGGNSIIGDRAFGSAPALVEEMGLAFARGVMEGGAIPCGKHFPGHGSAKQDSHRALAVLEDSGDALQAILRPFQTCTAQGIPMLMAGHIAAPGLGEPSTAASLSARMLRELVRAQWNYNGVLITDDINMGAVSRDPGAATVQALAAGNDAVMFLDPRPDRVRSVVKAIEAAVDAGTLSSADLARSEERLDAISDWLRVNKFLMESEAAQTGDRAQPSLDGQSGGKAMTTTPLVSVPELAPAPNEPPELFPATQESDTKKNNAGNEKKKPGRRRH